jgi:hypothetical protein
MSLRKHGLKAFGLSLLAALSLMAVSAAGAQASGEFLVETTLGSGVYHTFTQHGISLETVTGGFEPGVVGVLTITGLGTEIKCTGVTPEGGTVHLGGLVTGSLLYTGCTALESAAPLEELPCEVEDKGGDNAVGKIKTNALHGLVILHGTPSETYVLVKPAAAGPFVVILLLGAECAVAGEYPVTGQQMLLVAAGDALNVLVNPINNATLFPTDILKFGIRTATLSGSANLRLTGALADDKWGAF